jgi:hypothetical protein
MTPDKLRDVLTEFATNVDAASTHMQQHEIDMDGWSEAVNELIDEIVKVFSVDGGAKGQSDHEHEFTWEGATTDCGEQIDECMHEGCTTTRDSSGGLID